jgi:hypothetical protein
MATKAYKFVGLGDIRGHKARKFIGLGDIRGTNAYQSIGIGHIHGQNSYKSVGLFNQITKPKSGKPQSVSRRPMKLHQHSA